MIIEFWASWCGPCRMAFPHLSEMAKKYEKFGLIVLGLNIEGNPSTARQTVTQQGNKMDYLVAIDSAQTGSTKLMSAAGVSGIPCAFIIDRKGIIRHFGHPMEPKFSAILDVVCKESNMEQKREKKIYTRDELLQMRVRELKEILDEYNVGYSDLNEKSEVVDRILERCYSKS